MVLIQTFCVLMAGDPDDQGLTWQRNIPEIMEELDNEVNSFIQEQKKDKARILQIQEMKAARLLTGAKTGLDPCAIREVIFTY